MRGLEFAFGVHSEIMHLHCNEGYEVFLTNDEKYKIGYNDETYSGLCFGKQKNGNIAKINGTYRKLQGIIFKQAFVPAFSCLNIYP